MIQKAHRKLYLRLFLAGGLAALILLGMVLTILLILSRWPKFSALEADQLRNVVGDKTIAEVETIGLQSSDLLHQWEYRITNQTPSAPWETAMPEVNPPSNTASGGSKSASNNLSPSTPANIEPQPLQNGSSKPHQAPSVSQAWELPSIQPMGNIPGEGIWQAYIKDSSGSIVAQRVYLQPDATRPYAVVAIVAFDMQTTRLHFVLGNTEPKSTVSIPRTGMISKEDMQPGLLLAAFNGGFRAQDGNFGVVTDGVTLIPPRDGLGTVGIYADGRVVIGEWRTDIQPTPDLVVIRQNGPLMIHNGVINPNIADNNPQDWGYTIGGKVATFRSAIGISQDGRTLYYAAGGGLTRPELANAMLAAGVYQALQLDINDYWVHFDAFQSIGNRLVAVPLRDIMKQEDDHRYLTGFTRDFFYVTADQTPSTPSN